MEQCQRALGAIKLATGRLLSRYPLLGGIVSRWQLHADSQIKTMGVGLSDSGGFDLYYSPEFVLSIKLDELVGVLHHEVRHLLYGHPFMEPERFPDNQALVIAQEVTVNENLTEPRGAGWVSHVGAR
jgi:predicted metal-dependent peptidase